MARRQVDQLDAPAAEKGVGADEKRVRPLARERCKYRFDLLTGTGVVDLDLQPNGESSRLHVSHCRLGARRVGRIYQYGNASGRGYQFAQKFQPLRHQFSREKIDARQVSAGPSKAGDKTPPDWVLGAYEQ